MLANFGEVEFQTTLSKLRKRKRRLVFTSPTKREISQFQSHSDCKEMYKKAWCTYIVVVLPIQTYFVFAVFVAVAVVTAQLSFLLPTPRCDVRWKTCGNNCISLFGIQKELVQVSVKRDFPAARFLEAVPKPDLLIQYYLQNRSAGSSSLVSVKTDGFLLFHYRNFILKKSCEHCKNKGKTSFRALEKHATQECWGTPNDCFL